MSTVLSDRRCTRTFNRSAIPCRHCLAPGNLTLHDVQINALTRGKVLSVPSADIPHFMRLKSINRSQSIPSIRHHVDRKIGHRHRRAGIFGLASLTSGPGLGVIATTTCQRVFRQSVTPCVIGDRFATLRDGLNGNRVAIGRFVRKLNCSDLCVGRFCTPCPGARIVRFNAGRFLKQTPVSRTRVHGCGRVLTDRKVHNFVGTVLGAPRCTRGFNRSAIPCHHCPALPTTGFPGARQLCGHLAGRGHSLIIPDFIPTGSAVSITSVPLMTSTITTRTDHRTRLTTSIKHTSRAKSLGVAITRPTAHLCH